MRHISLYTRAEIIACLINAGLTHVDGQAVHSLDTELLRSALSDAIQAGDAPELVQEVRP